MCVRERRAKKIRFGDTGDEFFDRVVVSYRRGVKGRRGCCRGHM